MEKKLTRNEKKAMLGGVCAGIADYVKTDPTIIRLLWALGTIFTGGLGIIIYLVFWIIMPASEGA